MRRLTVLMALAAVVLVIGVSEAEAQATGNLSVTASVTQSCRVKTTSPVAFGSYDPLDTHSSTGSDLDGSGSVTVACTKGYIPTIGLNLGLNASGSTRRMKVGSEYLTYELYKEVGRTNVWGNSGADLFTPSSAPGSTGTAYDVYGRVPKGQDAAAGSYTDTVTVTVNY